MTNILRERRCEAEGTLRTAKGKDLSVTRTSIEEETNRL